MEFFFFSIQEMITRDDPRLRRLAESKIDNREEVRSDHPLIRQAEIVLTIEEESKRQEGLDAKQRVSYLGEGEKGRRRLSNGFQF